MEKKYPKILLAAPTSTYKDYIFMDWFLHASTLTYPNMDIVICDNSLDENYHKTLQAMGIKCFYVNPEGKHPRDYVCESQNALRDYFLANDYDYLFSYEVDQFGPRNIIEKLLCAKKPVVSGIYFIGQGKESIPLLFIWKNKDGKYINEQATWPEALNFMDGTVKQVYAAGIGCMLIERSIIEKIKFRIDPKIKEFSDTPFYLDLWNNGIRNYVDTTVLCKHYNSDWFCNIDAMKEEV